MKASDYGVPTPQFVSKSILKSPCYKYAEDACSGVITVSHKNVLACRRFISDLEQMHIKSYPWKFDIEKANRPIEFIERFLVPKKGSYDRMTLLPWQHFTTGNVFGWIGKADNLRRFREDIELIGRGNGKSTLIAGRGLYCMSKDGENGADIYVLANAKEQSKIIYDEVKQNVDDSPILSKHFRATLQAIYYDDTNSRLQHRASDSKKLDGLNTYCGIFDEIHEFKTWKLINIIKRSTNKRRQPLITYISTKGNVLDGPLMDLYMICSDVLNNLGAINQAVADRIFCYIAELDDDDDIDDTSTWIKANPSLGHLLDIDTLIADWERAKLVPSEKADFINKQLNLFTDTGEMSFLDADTIRKNDKVIDTEVLKDRMCYGGFDLSATEDFTSACLEFPLDDGSVFAMEHSWTTSKKVKEDMEKIDYYEMQRQGLLTVVDEDFIDSDHVYRWFTEKKEKYRIMSIGYDPANAPFLVAKLKNEGFSLNVVRQGTFTLSAPMKNLKELFLQGKVITNNSAMYRWYLSNVKVKTDDKGNIIPTKQGRYRKIDGFAAHLDAHTELIRQNPNLIEATDRLVTILEL